MALLQPAVMSIAMQHDSNCCGWTPESELINCGLGVANPNSLHTTSLVTNNSAMLTDVQMFQDGDRPSDVGACRYAERQRYTAIARGGIDIDSVLQDQETRHDRFPRQA